MVGFLFRAALSMVGLWIATRWVSGIRIDDAQTLVLAGVVLGVVNAIIRPITVILTLPLTILTLGLFLLVINAGMLAATGVSCRGLPRRAARKPGGESHRLDRFDVHRTARPFRGVREPPSLALRERRFQGTGQRL